MHKVAGTAIAIAGTMFLAGCGRAGTNSISEDAARGSTVQAVDPSSAPNSVATSEPEHPMLSLRDQIAPTADDEALFLKVADQLITSCLTNRGLSYADPAVPTAEEIRAQRARDRARELFVDESMVSQYGYHWPRVVPDAGRYAEQFATEHPEWIECAGLTREQMRTPPEGDAGVPSWAIEVTSEIRLGTYDAVPAAVEAWRQCMQGEGYETADLRKPSTTWDIEPHDEVAIALVDLHCRASSGYTMAKVSYLEEQTQAHLAEFRDSIERYLTDLESRLEHARSLSNDSEMRD